jgi:hypothetical protein
MSPANGEQRDEQHRESIELHGIAEQLLHGRHRMNGLIGVDAKGAGPGRPAQPAAGSRLVRAITFMTRYGFCACGMKISGTGSLRGPSRSSRTTPTTFIWIGSALVIEDEVSSNRIFGAPRGPREFLIDDHDARSVIVITIGELASGNQGQAQRPEVSGCRHPNARFRDGVTFRAAPAPASTAW